MITKKTLELVTAITLALGLAVLPAAAQIPEMILVPGGEFQMGDHNDGNPEGDEPLHAVYVDSFHMDIQEVSNNAYAKALNWASLNGHISNPDETDGIVYDSGGVTPYCATTSSSEFSQITWDGNMFGAVTGKMDHPLVMVTWYGAAAYANWQSLREGRSPCYDLSSWECDFTADGYRLPTEAEWEFACRGGECPGGKQAPYCRYPWSDDIDGSMANYTGSGDPYECGGQPYTTPVDFYTGELHLEEDFGWPCPVEDFQTTSGVNNFGLHDVAGNVWEWCYDWYGGSEYYKNSPFDNPHGPLKGTTRVLRGGSWDNPTANLRCANRGDAAPEMWRKDQGFRLALPVAAVPTVSQWGLVVMTLLLLIGGTLLAAQRRVSPA